MRKKARNLLASQLHAVSVAYAILSLNNKLHHSSLFFSSLFAKMATSILATSSLTLISSPERLVPELISSQTVTRLKLA